MYFALFVTSEVSRPVSLVLWLNCDSNIWHFNLWQGSLSAVNERKKNEHGLTSGFRNIKLTTDPQVSGCIRSSKSSVVQRCWNKVVLVKKMPRQVISASPLFTWNRTCNKIKSKIRKGIQYLYNKRKKMYIYNFLFGMHIILKTNYISFKL